MYTIDDPMFALITRFIGCDQKVTLCNHDFLQKQLNAIQEHIEKFPREERESHAIEWIEKYACEYRKRWEKETIDQRFTSQKCPDCPLAKTNMDDYCQIHQQWLELLQSYSADKINSKVYVENTLQLLVQCKDDLKTKVETGQRAMA